MAFRHRAQIFSKWMGCNMLLNLKAKVRAHHAARKVEKSATAPKAKPAKCKRGGWGAVNRQNRQSRRHALRDMGGAILKKLREEFQALCAAETRDSAQTARYELLAGVLPFLARRRRYTAQAALDGSLAGILGPDERSRYCRGHGICPWPDSEVIRLEASANYRAGNLRPVATRCDTCGTRLVRGNCPSCEGQYEGEFQQAIEPIPLATTRWRRVRRTVYSVRRSADGQIIWAGARWVWARVPIFRPRFVGGSAGGKKRRASACIEPRAPKLQPARPAQPLELADGSANFLPVPFRPTCSRRPLVGGTSPGLPPDAVFLDRRGLVRIARTIRGDGGEREFVRAMHARTALRRRVRYLGPDGKRLPKAKGGTPVVDYPPFRDLDIAAEYEKGHLSETHARFALLGWGIEV